MKSEKILAIVAALVVTSTLPKVTFAAENAADENMQNQIFSVSYDAKRLNATTDPNEIESILASDFMTMSDQDLKQLRENLVSDAVKEKFDSYAYALKKRVDAFGNIGEKVFDVQHVEFTEDATKQEIWNIWKKGCSVKACEVGFAPAYYDPSAPEREDLSAAPQNRYMDIVLDSATLSAEEQREWLKSQPGVKKIETFYWIKKTVYRVEHYIKNDMEKARQDAAILNELTDEKKIEEILYEYYQKRYVNKWQYEYNMDRNALALLKEEVTSEQVKRKIAEYEEARAEVQLAWDNTERPSPYEIHVTFTPDTDPQTINAWAEEKGAGFSLLYKDKDGVHADIDTRDDQTTDNLVKEFEKESSVIEIEKKENPFRVYPNSDGVVDSSASDTKKDSSDADPKKVSSKLRQPKKSDLKLASKVTVKKGKTKKLKLTLAKGTDKKGIKSISYKVKNKKICTIKKETIQAHKVGKTTITTTVKLKNGQKKTFRTTVQVLKK